MHPLPRSAVATVSAFLLVALSSIAHADIAIGMAGPLTGTFAPLGGQMRNGAEAAVADINAAGGVLGQKLALDIEDDACDPQQAVAVAEAFVSKQVVFVAGHLCSAASIPASAVYAGSGVIQISPGTTNPVYTDERPGPGTFRVVGRTDTQGAVAGAFLANAFAGRNIAIVDDKSAYGKGLADDTRAAVNAAGGRDVVDEEYSPGETTHPALITRLKAANVDLLYVGGYYPDAALLAREMKDGGMTTTLMGGDALMTDDFWKAAGSAGSGTLMTGLPDPRKDPINTALVARLRGQGIEPQGYTLYTYAAIQVWAQAAAAAGTTEFSKVATAIAAGTFTTALGKLTFDAKGDVTTPGYAVYRWSNGTYDYLAQ